MPHAVSTGMPAIHTCPKKSKKPRKEIVFRDRPRRRGLRWRWRWRWWRGWRWRWRWRWWRWWWCALPEALIVWFRTIVNAFYQCLTTLEHYRGNDAKSRVVSDSCCLVVVRRRIQLAKPVQNRGIVVVETESLALGVIPAKSHAIALVRRVNSDDIDIAETVPTASSIAHERPSIKVGHSEIMVYWWW